MSEYSAMKVFSHLHRVEVLRRNFHDESKETVFPVSAEFNLTNECNHRCSWCSEKKKMEAYSGEMPKKTALRAIHDMAVNGLKGITFEGGGEPTMCSYFDEVVDQALHESLQVGVITNGSLIHRHVDVLSSVSFVRVSLDAWNAKGHEKTHGSKDWERICDSIQKLNAKRGKNSVRVSFLVTLETYGEAKSMVKLADELGCREVQIKPVQDAATGKYLMHDDRMQVVEELVAEELKESKVSVSVMRRTKIHERPERCLIHRFATHVGADGQMHICCYLPIVGKTGFGNLNEHSFEDLWYGEAGTRKRDTALVEEIGGPSKCPRCRHDEVNHALCMAIGERKAFL